MTTWEKRRFLKGIRKENGLTQKEMATIMGLSYNDYRMLEVSSRTELTFSHLEIIKAVFCPDLDMTLVVKDDGNEAPNVVLEKPLSSEGHENAPSSLPSTGLNRMEQLEFQLSDTEHKLRQFKEAVRRVIEHHAEDTRLAIAGLSNRVSNLEQQNQIPYTWRDRLKILFTGKV